MLIDNGAVDNSLAKLVALQGLDIHPEIDPRGLNEVLQEHWVKAKGGILRAQLGGRFPTGHEMMLLEKLGCVNAIPMHSVGHFQRILILGATMKAMARRLHFLMDERLRFSRTLPFPNVTVLASKRKLLPEQESADCIPAIVEETGLTLAYGWKQSKDVWPGDEATAMRYLIEWSVALSATRFEILAAPDVPGNDGISRPSKTTETVAHWLSLNPCPGDYLILSSQPFCECQKLEVERAVRANGLEGFHFAVRGPKAPPLALSKWLDNLAKQLWEEVQLLPK